MSQGATLASFAPLIKVLYPDNVAKDVTSVDNPFWASVSKEMDFYGSSLEVPVKYTNPQSTSNTPSTAITARIGAGTRSKKFSVKRGHLYGVHVINQELAAATENDRGAFLRARKTEIDGLLTQLGNDAGRQLYREGNGNITSWTTAASSPGTATSIVLDNPEDIALFEQGMQLIITTANPTDSTAAAQLASSSAAYVVAIDRDAATLAFNASSATGAAQALNTAFAATISATSTQYYLAKQGDNLGFSSSSEVGQICGLASWLPITAPQSGESFWNMDRSSDTVRLGGVRFDARGLPLDEAFIRCAARVAREGGSPSRVYMNFAQYANVTTTLMSKGRYTSFKAGEIGFESFVIHGAKGDLEIVADRNCPTGRAYMLTPDTWCFHHLRAAPFLSVEGNANGVLQETDTFDLQVRALLWGQLVCNAPGRNAVMQLDA